AIFELLPTGEPVDALRRHSAGIVQDRVAVLTPGPARGTDDIEIFDLARDPHELQVDPPALAEPGAAPPARPAERPARLATAAAGSAGGWPSGAPILRPGPG